MIDIKTLRKINEGENVKIIHLETITNEMNDSLDDLISFDESKPYEENEFNVVLEIDLNGHIHKHPGKLYSFDMFINNLHRSSETILKLDTLEFNDPQEELIINFETIINDYKERHF